MRAVKRVLVVLGTLGALLAGACSTTAKKTDSATGPVVAPAAERKEPVKAGITCGRTICAPGEICCNASCGICAPPDGVCTMQICEVAPEAPTAATEGCKVDSDCRLFSDYCTGCNCHALAKTEKEPLCSGPGVRCLADPCMQKGPVCDRGKCVVKSRG